MGEACLPGKCAGTPAKCELRTSCTKDVTPFVIALVRRGCKASAVMYAVRSGCRFVDKVIVFFALILAGE
jgi:hypothetical protein